MAWPGQRLEGETGNRPTFPIRLLISFEGNETAEVWGDV